MLLQPPIEVAGWVWVRKEVVEPVLYKNVDIVEVSQTDAIELDKNTGHARYVVIRL